jgi:hypothetical protein
MTTQAYVEFREQLFERHQTAATSLLSTAADVLPALGVAMAVVRRDARWAWGGLASSAVVASVAHLFQPGPLRDEYAAILRHPVWTVRAERERVLGVQQRRA